MIKELEAFNRIVSHTEYDNDGSYDCLNFEDDCKLVDEALQRLESIENSKPSEALECLKSLEIQTRFIGILDVTSWGKYLPIIKQALLKAQEQEKVLEIAVKKGVDFDLLRTCNNAHEYNKEVGYSLQFMLTEEEFELLKRYTNEQNNK